VKAPATLPDNRLRTPLAELLAASDGDAPWADWTPQVCAWHDSAAGQATVQAVDRRLAAGATIYPADPLRALRLTPLAQVRAVILGQDPYHGPGQAEGLAFSVPSGVPAPPSLRNIRIELARDAGRAEAAGDAGSLTAWAEQGVLLLNTCLTVEDGAAAGHAKLGWQTLTSRIIEACVKKREPLVFLLWGASAQALGAEALQRHDIAGRHGRLLANHPSPLSARRPPRPFIGCGHFGQANRFLSAAGRGVIAAWPVPEPHATARGVL
jgi:uracil-DNA glycosylase